MAPELNDIADRVEAADVLLTRSSLSVTVGATNLGPNI
jgi:hypothetical protein